MRFFQNEPSKEYVEVTEEINKKVSKHKSYEIRSIEVTSYQWRILEQNRDFRREARRKNANIGGIFVEKSKKDRFKINTY